MLSGSVVNDYVCAMAVASTIYKIWGTKVMRSITPLAGRSILVVEDEPLIAHSLKELFEAEGADVHLASTPNEALRAADEIVLSAAVVDFGSNGDDSAWISRTLRAYGIPSCTTRDMTT